MRMNLNAVRKRVEALENVMAAKSGDGGVALSPYDAALLLIERQNLGDSPEDMAMASRIDEMLASRRRACARNRSEPMTPEEATRVLIKAAERDAAPDADERRQERLAELLAEA